MNDSKNHSKTRSAARSRLTVGAMVVIAGALAFAPMACSVANASLEQPNQRGPKVAPKVELGGVFENLDLQAAINKSRAESKVLIVELVPTNERKKAVQERWGVPLMATWAKAHAVVVAVGDNETIKLLAEGDLRQASDGPPLVFRDGKALRLFASNQAGESRITIPRKITPTTVPLILKLHWAIEGVERTDEAWVTNHRRAAAAVMSAMTKTQFAGRAATGIAAISEPVPAAADRLTAMLAKLKEARTLAASDKADDLARATGLYTAIFEIGTFSTAESPELLPATLTTVAGEMHALATKHAPSKQRFTDMYAARLIGLDWSDLDSTMIALMLARVADKHVEPLDFIDLALGDGDVVTMMPHGQRVMWDLLLPALHFSDISSGLPGRVKAADKMLDRIVKLDAEPKPEHISESQWRFAQQVRGAIVRFEVCRVTAALHAAGKDAEGKALRDRLAAMPGIGANAAAFFAAADAMAEGAKVGPSVPPK